MPFMKPVLRPMEQSLYDTEEVKLIISYPESTIPKGTRILCDVEYNENFYKQNNVTFSHSIPHGYRVHPCIEYVEPVNSMRKDNLRNVMAAYMTGILDSGL